MELEAKRDARLGLVEVEDEAIFCTRLDEYERLNGLESPQKMVVPRELTKADIQTKRRRTSRLNEKEGERTTDQTAFTASVAETKLRRGVPYGEAPHEESESPKAVKSVADMKVEEVDVEVVVDDKEYETPGVAADLPAITAGSAVFAWFENDYHPAVVIAAYSDEDTGEVVTVDVQFDGWGDGEDAFEYGKPVAEIKYGASKDEHAPETAEESSHEDGVQLAVTAPYDENSDWADSTPHEDSADTAPADAEAPEYGWETETGLV